MLALESISSDPSGNNGAVRTAQALGPTGILAEEDSPQKEVEGLERELAKTGGTRRLEFLPRLAKLTFWAGDADKAERYAKEAVSLLPGDGEATHDGNMILGLVALRRGDTERAGEASPDSVVSHKWFDVHETHGAKSESRQ